MTFGGANGCSSDMAIIVILATSERFWLECKAMCGEAHLYEGNDADEIQNTLIDDASEKCLERAGKKPPPEAVSDAFTVCDRRIGCLSDLLGSLCLRQHEFGSETVVTTI
jgi:hypothetical protein